LKEAKYAWTCSHGIKFDGRHIIDKGNKRVRKTLEPWHIAIVNDEEL
jgi:hypothetical protein